MALIDDIKLSLRITSTALDADIADLISSAKADLSISGVVNTNESDALIKRAITTYCKANFGWDNPDAERLQKSYDMLKSHLALSADYSFYTLTFTITDSVTTDEIQEASIKLWNTELNYEETKTTNASGIAIFNVRAKANYKYDITATDYESDLHEEDEKNIQDVSADTSVAVALLGV